MGPGGHTTLQLPGSVFLRRPRIFDAARAENYRCTINTRDVILLGKYPYFAPMAEAEYESIYYVVIQQLATDLASALLPEIDVVINKAWSTDLIGQQQLTVSMSSGFPPYQKARDFVSAIANRVKLQSNAFTDFQKLLRSIPSLSYLAETLDRKLSATTSRLKVTTPDSSKTNPPAPPQMAKLKTSEIDSGFSPDEKDSTSEQEEDCCKNQSFTNSLLLGHESSEAKVYVKAFHQIDGDVAALKHEEDENRPITQSEREKVLLGSLQETYYPGGELVGSRTSLPVATEHLGGKSEPLKEIEDGLRKAREEKRQKDAKIEHLESRLDDLKLKLESVEVEKERMERKKKEEIEDLQNQLKKKDEEVEKYKNRVHQMEKETQEKTEKFECKIKELETQQAEAKFESERSKQVYETKIQELVASLKSAQKEQKEKEVELANLRVKLAEKEVEFRDEMLKHEKEAGKLRDQLAIMEKSKLEVMVQLEKVKVQLEKTNVQVEKSKTENAEMRAAVAEEREQAARKQSVHECEQKDAIIQELSKKLSMLSTDTSG